MIKKISIYFSLILLSINIGNGNLNKIYSFVRQRLKINSISNEKINICYTLQHNIEKYISHFRNNISISILKDNGEFIVNINGDLPRIPASNQKILSSAFSLDNLGPYYTLNTSLRLLSDSSLYIEASGDPDFDIIHLTSLINELNNRKVITNKKIPIIIQARNSSYWWPSSWSKADRKEEYGAPITRYSLASNSSINALSNPNNNFINELKRLLRINNLSTKYYVKIVDKNYPLNYISTINSISSAPLYVLLNLVNSESHNFTSEVIFRHSLDNWSNDFPNIKYTKWLKKQNFNSDKFIFADASGLSRNNRVTTNGLSQFLRRMNKNRYSDYYFSSFSILGVRGSLSKVNSPINIKGKILAKSGTLSNVRSVSGILLENGNYFSIVVNNMNESLKYIIDILSIVQKENSCT